MGAPAALLATPMSVSVQFQKIGYRSNRLLPGLLILYRNVHFTRVSNCSRAASNDTTRLLRINQHRRLPV